MRQLTALLIAVACLIGIASHSPPAWADDVKSKVENLLAARFADGQRYILGAEAAGGVPRFCRVIESGDPLLAEPVVSPYRTVIGLTSAKLLECDYPANGAGRGWVIVVAVTAENLANRIVGACRAVVSKTQVRTCICRLIGGAGCGIEPKNTFSWGQNNLQFPVAGFVLEGQANCTNNGRSEGTSGLIGFRHGVTIQYGSSPTDTSKLLYCRTSPTPIADQRQIALRHSLHKVYDKGRVAGIDRNTIVQQDRPPPLDVPSTREMGPDDWQTVVMKNELDAVRTGVDRLMILRAAQAMDRTPPRL
jgi:hypothetical protein